MQASITQGKFKRWNFIQSRRGNNDSSLFGAHIRPNWGCRCCPGPEERDTSWHLMAVVRKGKISPVHAVASNRTQWKRQCKWWNFALFFTFETLSSILGVTLFNCWQLWRRAPLIFRDFGKIGLPNRSTQASLMFFFFSRFWNFWKFTNEGSHQKKRCVDKFSP